MAQSEQIQFTCPQEMAEWIELYQDRIRELLKEELAGDVVERIHEELDYHDRQDTIECIEKRAKMMLNDLELVDLRDGLEEILALCGEFTE